MVQLELDLQHPESAAERRACLVAMFCAQSGPGEYACSQTCAQRPRAQRPRRHAGEHGVPGFGLAPGSNPELPCHQAIMVPNTGKVQHLSPQSCKKTPAHFFGELEFDVGEVDRNPFCNGSKRRDIRPITQCGKHAQNLSFSFFFKAELSRIDLGVYTKVSFLLFPLTLPPQFHSGEAALFCCFPPSGDWKLGLLSRILFTPNASLSLRCESSCLAQGFVCLLFSVTRFDNKYRNLEVASAAGTLPRREAEEDGVYHGKRAHAHPRDHPPSTSRDSWVSSSDGDKKQLHVQDLDY